MKDSLFTVLVVDDDYHVAAVHAAFVERVPGFCVVGKAHTAADALELAESLQPDLVLMDIYLPDGDGLEVTRALFAKPAPPAVIVISAARDVTSVRLAVQLGAVDYLVKPFGFAALAERLHAFRDAHAEIAALDQEATQEDVNRIFGLLRPTRPNQPAPDRSRLAPTLRLVYDAVAASKGISAAGVAEAVGISRATAQRCLAQLEQSEVISLELMYGSAGRPEHRYTVRRH
ncbi:MAG TPA: two-component system response regulator [Microbacteriaceae bacterium]|jgi:response regulator of citrate/malate metabolism|nr:two-component system response regulator [Microbacteriaceae bacterium]